MPAVVYVVLWLMDLFITSNSNLDSPRTTAPASTTTVGYYFNQTAPPATAVPPFQAGFNLATIYQVLRFAAIYLIPPYSLAVSAIQIEGVCSLLEILENFLSKTSNI